MRRLLLFFVLALLLQQCLAMYVRPQLRRQKRKLDLAERNPSIRALKALLTRALKDKETKAAKRVYTVQDLARELKDMSPGSNKQSNSAGSNLAAETRLAKRVYTIQDLARQLKDMETKSAKREHRIQDLARELKDMTPDSTGKSNSAGSNSADSQLPPGALDRRSVDDFSGDFSGDFPKDFSGDFSGHFPDDFSGDNTFTEGDSYLTDEMKAMCGIKDMEATKVDVSEIHHFLDRMHMFGTDLSKKLDGHKQDIKKTKKVKVTDLNSMPKEVKEFIRKIQNIMYNVSEEATCIFIHFMPLIERIEMYGLTGFDEARTCNTLKTKVDRFMRDHFDNKTVSNLDGYFEDFMKCLYSDVRCLSRDISKFARNIRKQMGDLKNANPREIAEMVVGRIIGFSALAQHSMDLLEAISWVEYFVTMNQTSDNGTVKKSVKELSLDRRQVEQYLKTLLANLKQLQERK